MPMIDAILAEFEHESGITRKLLERLPDERLSWQPHDKSMSLSRLAGHLAEMPGWSGIILHQPELDFAGMADYKPFVPENRGALLAHFDEQVVQFRANCSGVSDESLFETWRMRDGDHVIAEMPRVAALRSWVLSHNIHHRGQLSVYLRLLDIPVPQIYGPSADEP